MNKYNPDSIPAETYYTTSTNSDYSGLSQQSKQRCLVNERTNERVTLQNAPELWRMSKLKNTKISSRIVNQLTV